MSTHHTKETVNEYYVNPCDASDVHGEYRLCWSIRSSQHRGGGDRCGKMKNLHNSLGWERVIYETIEI
jgi:hypothetical protein